MEWISVEDRLPDDESGYQVLVFANDIVSSWRQFLNHDGKRWVDKGGYDFIPIVTHWMQLPEPPNELNKG